MPGRRTNLALLCALAIAFLTGWLAFGVGTWHGRWVVAAHGAAGLAIVVLAPWKAAIARRGMARRGRGRGASVALSVAAVAALIAGVGHATGILRSYGPVTAMQAHVGAALVAIALAVWHVRARPQRPRRSDLGRRSLLRLAAVSAVAAVSWAAVEGASRAVRLPGARRRFTGSYETGSHDPERMPVTQWLDDRVPVIAVAAGEAGSGAGGWLIATAGPGAAAGTGTGTAGAGSGRGVAWLGVGRPAVAQGAPAGWRLDVRAGGLARVWTYEELAAFDDRVVAVLDCTGGWYAEQEWAGVWLDRLLPPVGRGDGAVEVVGATGYRRRFPLSDRGRLLLAVRVGGRPLSAGHGFPARLVAPGRRGFWWVKWVTTVEVTAAPWWRQPPFPLT